MKVSDYIVSLLAEHGVNVVFGYIGGMITHLVDSLGQSAEVRYVQTHHEQTAAIAAEGYAIESGKFGVAICTSGPGVTNMITGIADAYFGSIPVLYISGQVNTYEYKYDKPIRQQGFQEMDVVSIVKPITKYAVLLDDAENVCYELEKAIYIATHGRKGPVVVDLPMNISRADIDLSHQRRYIPNDEEFPLFNIENIRSLVESSKRPMILVGGGCRGNAMKERLDVLTVRSNIPIVTSLMGRGIINENYPHYVGMIGSYGNRCANMAVSQSDLLIVLGSRLDTRQTGALYGSFLKQGRIIHVDIDCDELENNRLENRIQVRENVSRFVDSMNAAHFVYQDYSEWNDWIDLIKNKYGQASEVQRFVKNKSPYFLLEKINEFSEDNDIFTVDIGQNQMWAAQMIRLKANQAFVTSGGLAPMGFSLPAAIGMSFASPGRKIFCITGDGGLNMAIQSLAMIAQYGLNIKVIVLNNASLGMITQFQHLYFNDRMYGTTITGGYQNPDFKALANAYGIKYVEVNDLSLKNMFKSDTPMFVNCIIDELTTVSPKLEYNKPIEQPSPNLPEDEFNDVMSLIQ